MTPPASQANREQEERHETGSDRRQIPRDAVDEQISPSQTEYELNYTHKRDHGLTQSAASNIGNTPSTMIICMLLLLLFYSDRDNGLM